MDNIRLVWSLVTCILVPFLLTISSGIGRASAFSPRSIRNCTTCHRTLGDEIQQFRRLQIIRKRIETALNIERNVAPVDVQSDGVPDNTIKPLPDTEQDEIISFSHTIGRQDDSSLLEFVIHSGPVERKVEVVSANLWVLVRKRGRNRKGKRIVLKVFQLNDRGHSLLTYLRTKVRKTRWQKLSLPISLVQNLVQPPEGKLQLRIDCRRCGRMVKLVLPKDKHRKKRKRDNEPTLRGLRRNRTIKRRPFLHIFTRVKVHSGS